MVLERLGSFIRVKNSRLYVSGIDIYVMRVFFFFFAPPTRLTKTFCVSREPFPKVNYNEVGSEWQGERIVRS